MGSTKILGQTGKYLFVAFAMLMFFSPAGAVKADMASDIVLANTCFSCHGTDGDSVGAMPTIKGKSAKYIEDQLNQFREEKRKGTVMNRIAKGFTADEIKTLARYFAGQQ